MFLSAWRPFIYAASAAGVALVVVRVFRLRDRLRDRLRVRVRGKRVRVRHQGSG